MIIMNKYVLWVLFFALLASACSDSSRSSKPVTDDAEDKTEESRPFDEILKQGVNRYIGKYTPMSSEVNGAVTTHTFGTGDGPLCLDGSAYKMSVRDTASENLMIYLQGGGACWSKLCAANETAHSGIPDLGVLSTSIEHNPFKDWNVAYFNYCDGSLHAGDKDTDSNNDGSIDRYQRGLHNLSAGLDVTRSTFKAPKRIAIVGVSGGAFGSIFALPIVRAMYPDVQIDIVNDSGIGIGRPGDDRFQLTLLEEWNMTAFVPPSCDNCFANGHLTRYLDWQLNQDRETNWAALSYLKDATIADYYVGIGGDAFATALVEEMTSLEGKYPDRIHVFLKAGTEHTFLLNRLDVAIDDITVADWVNGMIIGSPLWRTLIENSTTEQ